MNFKKEYISRAQNEKQPDSTKIELSNESYALCSLIDELSMSINRLTRAVNSGKN